jgi:myosin heavy subunit
VPAHCNINIGREGDKQTTEMIKFWAKQVLEVLLSGFVVDVLGTIKEPYACGKTRIYFRTGALEYLEVKREQYYGVTVTIIQRFIRCKLLRWNYSLPSIIV